MSHAEIPSQELLSPKGEGEDVILNFASEASEFAVEELSDVDGEPAAYIVKHPESDHAMLTMGVDDFDRFAAAVIETNKILSVEVEIDGEVHKTTTIGSRLDSLATSRPVREIYEIDESGHRSLVDCQYAANGHRCPPSSISRGAVVETVHFDVMMGISQLEPRWAGLLAGAEGVRFALFGGQGDESYGIAQCFVWVGEGAEVLAAEMDRDAAKTLIEEIRDRTQITLTFSGDPGVVQAFEKASTQSVEMLSPAPMP